MHPWPPTRLLPFAEWRQTTGSIHTHTSGVKPKHCFLRRCQSLTVTQRPAQLITCMQTELYTHVHRVSPHDEVKLRPCQHENAKERGDGSVNHGGEHVLQRHCRALVSVADRCQKALQQRNEGWEKKMSWKSCRSHKTCPSAGVWHSSEFLLLALLGIATRQCTVLKSRSGAASRKQETKCFLVNL